MKFFDVAGRPRVLRNSRNYLIDWEKQSRSKFQKSVKDFLQPYWQYDIVFEEMRIVGTRLSLDLYNANKKVAVEVQGRQHTKFIPHFHRNRLKFREQLSRDEIKLDFCRKNDISLIEIYPEDLVNVEFFNNFGNVL